MFWFNKSEINGAVNPRFFIIIFLLGVLIIILLSGINLIHKQEVSKNKKVFRDNLKDGLFFNFEERFLNATQSLSRIRDYLSKLQEQNRQLNEKIKELNSLLEAKEKENAQLIQSYSELKEELERIRLQQNDLRDKLAQKDIEFSKLNLQKATLEAKINELNIKLSLLTEINSSLEDKLAQNQKDKFRLEEEINKIRVDLTKKAQVQLQEKIEEFNQLLNAKEKERLDLVSELGQLKTQLNELNLTYEIMKNNLAQLSEMFSKKELELIQKNEQILKLKQEYEQIAKEKDALLFALQEKERTAMDLNVEVGRLQKKISDLQIELGSVIEKQKKTLEQLSQANSLNASLHERLLRISEGRARSLADTQENESKLKADELRKKVEVMLDILDIKDKQ
ncbi:MAG: hypothetical protein NC912_06770 [Candidatus Omnitrophica bacterium]|nr:hypothetical protein [Candidatus Omnitrophota bacterium]